MHQHNENCGCYEGSQYVEAALEDLDKELKEKITPKGSARKLSRISVVNITEHTFNMAIALLEELMDGKDGVLKAKPVGDKPDDSEIPLYDDTKGTDWKWYYAAYYYRKEKDNYEIDEEEKDELALSFLDAFIVVMLGTTAGMILKEISIQSWTHKMRDYIKQGTAAKYLLGIGGKNVIDRIDVGEIKKLVAAQFVYLQKFAEEIRNGELSGARILQRVGMYGEAVTHGYEKAKARSHNIVLPEYPADGNQQCHMNCRCHWKLEDDPKKPEYVLATWKMNPLAEHCQSCLDNAVKWNPLRVKKRLNTLHNTCLNGFYATYHYNHLQIDYNPNRE